MTQIQWIILESCVAVFALPFAIGFIANGKYKAIRPAAAPAKFPPATEPFSVETPPEKTIRFGDVVREYDSRRQKIDAWSERIDRDLREQQGQTFESMPPSALLTAATHEERENLRVVLACPSDSSPSAMEVAIRSAGSHSVAVAQRKLRGLDPYVFYSEVVHDVAKKCGAKELTPGLSAAALEQIAVTAALAKALKKATPEQRQKILDEIAAAQTRSGKGVATAAGALILANLSGFGLYLAATTILGGITSVLGITLPFAVFTGLTTLLNIAIGPVGWLALAAWAVKIGGGVNYKKTMISVFLVASIRGRLVGERDQRIVQLRSEREIDLKRAVDQLELLRRFVEGRRAATRDDEGVRVFDVPSWESTESTRVNRPAADAVES